MVETKASAGSCCLQRLHGRIPLASSSFWWLLPGIPWLADASLQLCLQFHIIFFPVSLCLCVEISFFLQTSVIGLELPSTPVWLLLNLIATAKTLFQQGHIHKCQGLGLDYVNHSTSAMEIPSSKQESVVIGTVMYRGSAGIHSSNVYWAAPMHQASPREWGYHRK